MLFLLCLVFALSQSVPFVTKRVSLHNPIAIDFSGWRPLDRTDAQLSSQSSSSSSSLSPVANDKQFLTVPVAVETDSEHVLSDQELNQIREHVIHNWKQQPIRAEAFPHLRPLVPQLLPKPEVEVEVPEVPEVERRENSEEYTFVKMDKSLANATEENLFHAYFAPKEHIPPEGYIRLTKSEFKNVFKNAEILFV